MIQNIIKILIIMVLFVIFPAKIYYISFATMLSGIVIATMNFNLTKRLTPELKISKVYFRFKDLKILIASGIWNSINSLASSLFNGLDLMLANLLLNEKDMGILSISKSIPAIVGSFFGSLSGLFTPTLTMLFANKLLQKLTDESKKASKIYSLVLAVPVVGFVVFGRYFYSLWLPHMDEESITMIYYCAVLSILPYLAECVVYPLKSLNVVANKLKVPMFVNLIGGIFSVILTFILVKFTSFGILAIAGTSAGILILINVVFTPIYACYILKIDYKTFYPVLGQSMITIIALFLLFYGIKCILPVYSWGSFFCCVIIAGGAGYLLSFLFLVPKGERTAMINQIKNRFRR